MEKYFSIYDTEAAYQLDSSTLPKPNISLIQATADIKTKKFEVTTVAAPVITNIDHGTYTTMGGYEEYDGRNTITLSCATPGAEIRYYVTCYDGSMEQYTSPDLNAYELEQEYNPNGENPDWQDTYVRNWVEDFLKTTSNTDYIYNNPFNIWDNYNNNNVYGLFAIAHIGNNWSEFVNLTNDLEVYKEYYDDPTQYNTEEPPYEEPPYEEPYEEGGEP